MPESGHRGEPVAEARRAGLGRCTLSSLRAGFSPERLQGGALTATAALLSGAPAASAFPRDSSSQGAGCLSRGSEGFCRHCPKTAASRRWGSPCGR